MSDIPVGELPLLRSRNLLVNGDMSVAQQGTTFDSTTTPANSDDTYMLDQWILLSDGNDIVDVTQQSGGGVSGNADYIRLDVETVSKKFGILQPVENKNCKSIIGGFASIGFDARVSDITKLSDIRAVVVSWDGTADSITSDIVSTWNAEGTVPSLVANWTAENVAANLSVTASWARYTIEGISIDTASAQNVAVFLYQNNVATNDTLGTLLEITNVQLEPGAIATDFEQLQYGHNLETAQDYFRVLNSSGASNVPLCTGLAYSTTAANGAFVFQRPMRVTPTISFTNPTGFVATDGSGVGKAATSLVSFAANKESFEISITVASGLTVGQASLIRASSTTSTVVIDSRL